MSKQSYCNQFNLIQTIQFSVSTISVSKTVLFKTIQFSISTVSMTKTVLFQLIQLGISMQFSSIWLIDRTPSGASTLGHSGPESDGNEWMIRIPQSSSFTRTSPSDCLVSYAGHSLGGGESYPSAKKQLVYFIAPADWTK